MVVDTIRGDIFQTPFQHIAFAVNTEGYNDEGVAGAVSCYWPELINTGPKELGTVLRHNADGRTFYALFCHSLSRGGWEKTAEAVTECLDKIEVPDEETIAIVLIGDGVAGKMWGADPFEILGGMARSKKKVVVYTL